MLILPINIVDNLSDVIEDINKDSFPHTEAIASKYYYSSIQCTLTEENYGSAMVIVSMLFADSYRCMV
ncbi:hypothetical protein [Candidatus Pseudomonas adelgestsugas]|uniref:Uncharacterized protein n=1 Tax=Candidatus Pseudomonas adelgestsugas TaxID=1302376 RepID=A0ABX5R7Q9_9PSED|nr:hypothetical protein [Candidatus Pseudomonas adelgestsugas]QAX81677.1 hypothetical protein C3B55_00322 [Candidatus Pseudomonas adelgestsugas]